MQLEPTPLPASGYKIPWFPLALGLGAVLLFGLAYTQSPLYFSNQHQYFVHGLADGGFGHLDEDWLANTRDPTPAFTALVAWTYRLVGAWWFHVEYLLLLGVYLVALLMLAESVPGWKSTLLARFSLASLLIMTHAAIGRVLSVQLTGVDYPWYLQCGLAGQYVLGTGLQPSAFGVFLVASLVAFVRGRLVLATMSCCLAALFHATYLLHAAILIATFMTVLARKGEWQRALLMGGFALLLVLPEVIYSWLLFAPSGAEAFEHAQWILTEVRIPHHARVDRWFDIIAGVQIAWFLLALFLVRRSVLFPLMALPALAGLVLTLTQLATGSRPLALLFPWRISAVLIPVATTVILAHLVIMAASVWERKPLVRGIAWAVGTLLLAVACGGGLWVSLAGVGYGTNDDELAVLEYIRDHVQEKDVYLIPVSLPKLGSGKRGSVSTTFTPPPRARKDRHLIPVDLQRFRLATGAPLYVDFKSIPYSDLELGEWYSRLEQCEEWYAEREWDSAQVAGVAGEGITHVVATADRDVHSPMLDRVYADESYRVYRIRRDGEK